MSVKQFVAPKLWNPSKGKAIDSDKKGREINLYLDAVAANIFRVRRDLELSGMKISTRTVIDHYLGKDKPERHTLMEVFRERNEKRSL